MKRLIKGFAIAFLTFSIGISLYLAWPNPTLPPLQDFQLTPESSRVFIPKVETEAKTFLEGVNLYQCSGPNPFTHESYWKAHWMATGGLLNWRALCGGLPAYPKLAKEKNVFGVVTVQVIVDEVGDVTSAHPASGPPLLYEAAAQAAYQTRFLPTLVGGEVVRVRGVLTYKFLLSQDSNYLSSANQ